MGKERQKEQNRVRVARFRKRRKAEGMVERTVWIPQEDVDLFERLMHAFLNRKKLPGE